MFDYIKILNNNAQYLLNFKVTKHRGLSGTFDKSVGLKPQDVPAKKRSLALRAVAGDRQSDTAGVVCWVLTASHKAIKV